MFIPYRAGIKITRIPVMTIVVALVCLFVYWSQDRNDDRIIASAKSYCTASVATNIEYAQKHYIHSDSSCWDVLTDIYYSDNPETNLKWYLGKFEAAGHLTAAETLDSAYHSFAAQAPAILTDRLARYSGSWNPVRMLTAVISHGSWDHLIGNLFFFVTFAMVVETVIGPVLFLLVFLAMAFGNGAIQNLLTLTREGGSSHGLSGVVMAFMTLAAYFSPKVKIKFFYFFFLLFGVLSWPLWSVAVWWVFWNIWDYVYLRDSAKIGFAAHLAGAAMGLIIGLSLFREKRHWVAEHMVSDELTLRDEESWLSKYNAIVSAPVVMYFVFIYGIAVFSAAIYLVATFIETFSVQLLFAAPAVAAAIQIYRMKRGPTPPLELYQKGVAALDAHRFQEALRILKPLAEGGYTRAQYSLGRLYATLPGGYRYDPEALRWYQAAAKRNHAQAQLEIGTRHMHGEQLPKDLKRAIEWLEKAAAQGVAQAAQSLGHIYENMLGNNTDKEKAIEWYYRAAVAFQKSGNKDDAQAMIRHLESLTGKHPTVLGLVAKLEKLVAELA